MTSTPDSKRKPDPARRTEGEGVPARDASIPASGNDSAERHREDGAHETAEPQRRKPAKVEER